MPKEEIDSLLGDLRSCDNGAITIKIWKYRVLAIAVVHDSKLTEDHSEILLFDNLPNFSNLSRLMV